MDSQGLSPTIQKSASSIDETATDLPISSPMPAPIENKHTLRCSIVSDSEFIDATYAVSTNSDGSDGNSLPKSEEERDKRSKKWIPKAEALCKDLWPSAKHDTLSIKYLSHGSYNTVLSLSMVITDDKPVDYVLRIPDTGCGIHSTVANLEYLTKHTDLVVPKVIKWDATENNSLRCGFVILSRLPGKCLEDVFKDLSHDQKLLLAKQLARLYHQIESVTNPFAGLIRVHKEGVRNGADLSDLTFIEAPGLGHWNTNINPIVWSNSENGIISLDRLRRDPPDLTVNEIMLSIHKRRQYQHENHELGSHCDNYYVQCQKIAESLVNLGLFKPQNDIISLRHPDLFPRNIMVDFTPDIVITSTLDWDHAMFAPRFVSRIPPRWLWRSPPEKETELFYIDVEPLDPKENDPDSPENAEIKQAFEDAVGENWLSEANGNGYSFARKLYNFGMQPCFNRQTIHDMRESIKQWRSSFSNPPSIPESEEPYDPPGSSSSENGETDIDVDDNIALSEEKSGLSIADGEDNLDHSETAAPIDPPGTDSQERPESNKSESLVQEECETKSMGNGPRPTSIHSNLPEENAEDDIGAWIKSIMHWVLSVPETTIGAATEEGSGDDNSTEITTEAAESLPQDPLATTTINSKPEPTELTTTVPSPTPKSYGAEPSNTGTGDH